MAAPLTLDLSKADVHEVTLTQAVNAVTLNNATPGQTVTLVLIQSDGNGYQVAGWPAAVKWAGGGSSPVLSTGAGKRDSVRLYYDGTNFVEVARAPIVAAPDSAAMSDLVVKGTPGLQAWWPGNGTPGLNDADAVATWAELSGAGRHGTQATAGQKPTFRAKQFGALPGIDFDGGDQLATALSATLKPFTLVGVVKPTSFAANRTIIGSSANGGIAVRANTSGALELLAQNSAIIAGGTTPLTAGVAALIAVTFDAAGNFVFRKDRAVTNSGLNNVAFSGAGTIIIGAQNGLAEPFLGQMGSLAVFNTVLSATDLGLVEAAMRSKWGTP